MIPPKRRKILFITGTRADFGKLRPLMEEVERHPSFECHVFATGMHMLSRYGYTYIEVAKAGIRNIFPCLNQSADTSEQMDFVLASTIMGLGNYIRELKPALIVVHGDRVETLAGSIVGALNNIRVAHIEGGEISGTGDDLIRHAVTKLSHLHYVANEEAKNRVSQLGETENSIFLIGSPDIDVMLSDRLPSIEEVKLHYEIGFEKYAILIYHSVTTELEQLSWKAAEVVDAVFASAKNYVVIYPNNDRGSKTILHEFERLKDNSRIRLLPSIRFEYFLQLLKRSEFIIGNSSAGIREAPVYGVPTINLGNRQRNRFNHSSILNVSENSREILRAIEIIPHRAEESLHFGKGDSARRFIRSLENPLTWRVPAQKEFFDINRVASADIRSSVEPALATEFQSNNPAKADDLDSPLFVADKQQVVGKSILPQYSPRKVFEKSGLRA